MSDTGYQKISCPICSGHIEFPANVAGTGILCPHCGNPIQLPTKRLPSWRIYAAGLIFSLLAIVGGFYLNSTCKVKESYLNNGNASTNLNLNQATNFSASVAQEASAHNSTEPVTTNVSEPKTPSQKSLNDLSVGKITLQKKQGSHLVYAVGTMKNTSGYQHFGVKVELELYDDQGAKLGSTKDYLSILEPHKSWTFHALVTYPKATVANLHAITEE
jgi:hypothetical protein